jgi:hypothetical protein
METVSQKQDIARFSCVQDTFSNTVNPVWPSKRPGQPTRACANTGPYDGLDVEFIIDVTGRLLFLGYNSPVTWNKIEEIFNQYHLRAMGEYERVGFLVTVDRGLYRVRRAFRKKNSNESEFYFGGKDRRHFHGFVTIGRDRGWG